jgi:hypothetical protein
MIAMFWHSLFGLVLGGLACGTVGAFFVITRDHRRLGKLPFILFCYIFVGGLLTGPVLGLAYFPELVGIQRLDDPMIYGYLLSMLCGVVLILRPEMKWRRTVGIRDCANP